MSAPCLVVDVTRTWMEESLCNLTPEEFLRFACPAARDVIPLPMGGNFFLVGFETSLAVDLAQKSLAVDWGL